MPIDPHRVASAPSDAEGAIIRRLAAALSTSGPMTSDAEHLLHGLAGAVRLAGGVLWLPHGSVLVAKATWAAERSQQQALGSSVHAVRIERGVGPLGKAWETGEPQTATPAASSGSPDAVQFKTSGLRSSLAVPARQDNDVLGVVELYARNSAGRDDHREALAALRPAVHLLGGIIERWTRLESNVKLTRRELEMLVLASRGTTSTKIASELSISPCTVKTHFDHIRTKLGVADRAAAVAVAIRSGMIV